MKTKLKILNGIFALFVFVIPVKAQRYLTEIFNSVNKTNNIIYGNSVNYLNVSQNLYLDFYEALNDSLLKRPLIVYIHGGGFTDSSNHKSMSHIVTYCETMAKKGYAVASIDYRLDTSISNRAVIHAMHDAKAAIRFFRANATTYKIDTSLIFVGGESAGAVTALTTTYINQTNEVLYPPTPPYSVDSSVEGNSGNPNFSSAVRASMCNCGGTETAFNHLMFDTLAMQIGNPPIMVVHGTSDPLVPFQKAVNISKRANQLAIPNLFYAFKGATHCPWFVGLANQNLYLDSLIDYTTSFLYASIITSIPSLNNGFSQLKVYPNPVNDVLNINYNAKIEEIKLTTIEGKNIQIQKVAYSNNVLKLDVSNLHKGIYLIQIKSDKTLYQTSFIKTD